MAQRPDVTERHSLAELRAMRDRGETRTRADAPARTVDESFWREARITKPVREVQTRLRIYADVLAWFKAEGRGFQTHMNAVLRAYVDAQQEVDDRQR